MSSEQKQKNYMLPIVIMVFLFGMISFVTNLAAPMGKILTTQFNVSPAMGLLGNFANFIAYAVMGIPGGIILTKYGYKKTALAAVTVGLIGVFIQYLSGGQQSFLIYLIGAFVSGFSMCLLNMVVNPMLNTLGGGGNKGNQLIQIGGVFNSSAAVAVYIIMGALIGDAAKAHISDATPALMIALAIFIIAFIVILFTKIDEPDQGTDAESQWELVKGACKYRHFVLGVFAIGIYGAVEVGPPTYILQYLTAKPDAAISGLGMDAGYCGTLGAVYFLLMLIGRFLGGVVGGKVSTRAMMSTVSAVALVLLAVGIFLPTDVLVAVPGVNWVTLELVWGDIPVGILLFLLVGLCASVMWGGIFNLATEGLGKYTAIASGLFMMMVCGFAIMIGIQALVADVTKSYLVSFFVPVAAAAYLLFYSLVGSKPAHNK